MTDHSILRPSLPDLPFRAEARLITNVLHATFVKLPQALGRAIQARNLYETLAEMGDRELNALGVARADIAHYALAKAGLGEAPVR